VPGVEFGQEGKRAVRFTCASSQENIERVAMLFMTKLILGALGYPGVCFGVGEKKF
jgi:hypothetical protein